MSIIKSLKVTTTLINSLIDGNLTVSVYDGEEFTVKRSTNVKDILHAVYDYDANGQVKYMSTEMMTLKVRDAEGNHLGDVMLVDGNGAEVIADYHVSLESYVAKANHLADALSF